MRYQVSRRRRQDATREWSLAKESRLRELETAVERSPILVPLSAVDHGPEVRFTVAFLVPTLVRPGPRGEVRTAGPVLAGIRYHEDFLAEPPISWEVACVFSPGADFFHPNARGPGSGAAGVCLGHVPCAVGLEALLCMLYAGLVLAGGAVNTVEWEGMNPEAAAYVREHAEAFPIVPTGLYEAPPPELFRPLHLSGLDLLTAAGFAAEALP